MPPTGATPAPAPRLLQCRPAERAARPPARPAVEHNGRGRQHERQPPGGRAHAPDVGEGDRRAGAEHQHRQRDQDRPVASRCRPGPGNATPSPATIRTRGKIPVQQPGQTRQADCRPVTRLPPATISPSPPANPPPRLQADQVAARPAWSSRTGALLLRRMTRTGQGDRNLRTKIAGAADVRRPSREMVHGKPFSSDLGRLMDSLVARITRLCRTRCLAAAKDGVPIPRPGYGCSSTSGASRPACSADRSVTVASFGDGRAR